MITAARGAIAQADGVPRVAIISRLYPRPYKPHAVPFNREQFKRLAQRYRVSLLVPVPWNEWILHWAELAPATRDGLSIRYACWLFPPKVGRTLYPLWFGLSLLPELRWLQQLRPSCLLVSWVFPDAVGAVLLSRALNIPLLIKAYGSDVNMNVAHPLRAVQMRWAARHAVALICVSEALKQRLCEVGVPRDKISVIPTGVDPSRFAPVAKHTARAACGWAQDRRMILFVGNVLKTKGIVELFAAFARLAGERSDTDLVVVGDGPESGWLQQQLARAGLERRSRLTGRLSHEQVASWVNAADVLCLPSHNEGLPNVVLEAMACGIPVVATRVGGIPEAVTKETGELVEPRSEAALADALARALDRSWDPAAIVEQARRFSWDANIAALSALFDRAIVSRGASA